MPETERPALSESERIFLKRILSVLLSAKGSCLHSCADGTFVHLLMDGPQHFAIEQLITHFGLSEDCCDLVAAAYLDRFENGPRGTFAERDALEYAYRTAVRFRVSEKTAERLVGCIAKAGWYGRLEAAARTLCKRDPLPEEVGALFESYVAGASYGTSTEKRLAEYARRYMPPEAACAQIARIEARSQRAALEC